MDGWASWWEFIVETARKDEGIEETHGTSAQIVRLREAGSPDPVITSNCEKVKKKY